MRISVIGAGYVGQVTATCFAEIGNDVLCMDVDAKKIRTLSTGAPTIYETGLSEMLSRNVKEKRLTFSTSIKDAVEFGDLIFICVNTPQKEDGTADLQHVFAVAKEIGSHMKGYKIIITKSTVPLGTSKKIQECIAMNTKYSFDVASNPEFLREGRAIRDFMAPDRIVIGTDSEKVGKLLGHLYSSVARSGKPIISMDISSAELVKYASNCMLATRISFMNMLSSLCEKTGADIKHVAHGMGLDDRIGPRFLQAGLGFGGSCLPKDVAALLQTLKQEGCDSSLLVSVLSINEHQKNHFSPLFKKFKKGAKVALWGLSFKPDTDDIREAPSLEIIKELLDKGIHICAFDPVANEHTKKLFPTVEYVSFAYDALKDADALIIATEWNEFRQCDFERMKKLMKKPLVFDGRNVLDPKEMREQGFEYYSIGRP